MKLKVTNTRKEGVIVESRLRYLMIVPVSILVLSSAWLCYNGINGWGWMLISAVLISGV